MLMEWWLPRQNYEMEQKALCTCTHSYSHVHVENKRNSLSQVRLLFTSREFMKMYCGQSRMPQLLGGLISFIVIRQTGSKKRAHLAKKKKNESIQI